MIQGFCSVIYITVFSSPNTRKYDYNNCFHRPNIIVRKITGSSFTVLILTLCSRVVNLIKSPCCPHDLNSLNVQLKNVLLLTF
jgi:hypothetical protein